MAYIAGLAAGRGVVAMIVASLVAAAFVCYCIPANIIKVKNASSITGRPSPKYRILMYPQTS